MKLLLTIITTIISLNAQPSRLNIYYDTKDLYLLKNNISLQYQVEKNNEIIILKLKNNKEHTFEVAHYNRVKFIEEKHKLLKLIKRDQRVLFITLLKEEGIKYPMKLKSIFTIVNNIKNYKENYQEKVLNEDFFIFKFKYPYFYDLIVAIFISFLLFLPILIINLIKNNYNNNNNNN